MSDHDLDDIDTRLANHFDRTPVVPRPTLEASRRSGMTGISRMLVVVAVIAIAMVFGVALNGIRDAGIGTPGDSLADATAEASGSTAPSSSQTAPSQSSSPSASEGPMTLDEWRLAQEDDGLECAQQDNTNPDVPTGISLTCERTVDGAALRVTSDYTPEGQPRQVHATMLPAEPGGPIGAEVQVNALSVVVAYRYADADPAAALAHLTDFLSNPNCEGSDCTTEIGSGTFRLQTGEGGAWVVSLELGATDE